MKRRNTKQKQIVLDTLRTDKTHPTIGEIYKKVSKKYPKIGQATVYRNVNELLQTDQIEKIVDLNGNFHYDGNPIKHIHLLCKNCNKIYDIFDFADAKLIKQLSNDNEISIDKVNITLEGLCKECTELLSKLKK